MSITDGPGTANDTPFGFTYDEDASEFDRFEILTKRLVAVPKDEIDAKRREADV